MIKVVDGYCEAILTGAIFTGIHIKNAVKRFKADLKRADLIFREDAVEKVINFIGSLKHFTGKWANLYFELEPWQQFIIANLYGFYYKDTNKRRYQTAYIEVAKKNGKTALSAALGLYHLVADGEPAAEILLAANSKDQAKRCFDTVRAFSKGYDPEEKYLRRYRADIIFPQVNSFIKVLAADADKLDGYNCSLGIIDEYHSAPNSMVRDVIRSSMGMRVNPLLITITTAGFDKSLPCYELRTVATEVVAGIKGDDSFFGAIYSLDQGDDWKDEKTWEKANPNIEVTVNKDFLRKQVQQAVNSPSDEVGVRTKNLNEWCDTATTWIPDDYILFATKRLNKGDFKGWDCYIGVDLSSNVDLTAVSYLFVKDEKYHFITEFYLPNESLKTRADRELYKDWKRQKHLITTAGNVTDYDYITRDILALDKSANICKVYYDKYNATSWAIQATDSGLPLYPFGQSIGNFNSTTRTFERLILGGQVVLDDNPIMRYCLRNVELRQDYNGNVKPNKLSEKKKIDGVIAALQALAAYLADTTGYVGNIY